MLGDPVGNGVGDGFEDVGEVERAGGHAWTVGERWRTVHRGTGDTDQRHVE
jgi:hypothetical protein